MRSTSWIKLLLVFALCFTGFQSNAQVIKKEQKPTTNDDGPGSNCQPYVAAFLKTNPPNPSPSSNYELEMRFDIGGFDDIDNVKQVYFEIATIDQGATKHYVLDYNCCIPVSHGDISNQTPSNYYFKFFYPSLMANSTECDNSFFVTDCDGISLTEDTPFTEDQLVNYLDHSSEDSNDSNGVDCPGVNVDVIGYGGNGLLPNCNIHRLKIVGAYYSDFTGQTHPITKLYGDQVCVGGCYFHPACNSLAYKLTETAAEVKIYPNPVRDELTIELLDIAQADVKVFNINGEILYTQLDVTERTLEIDVQDYSQGVYIISVESEAGTFQKKFTKL